MGVRFMVKFVVWTPVFNAAFLCVMATICFALAYHKGTVSIYIPSISETGSTTPSLYFFMFGTMISSISVSIIVLYRYLVLRYYLDCEKKHLHLYNNCICVVGLLSAFALLSLTPFPLSLNRVAHTSIAICHFFLCMCYTCLDTLLNAMMTMGTHRRLRSAAMHRLRTGLCIAHAILGVLFITLYPVARQLFIKNNLNGSEDLKEPSDKMFAFFFMACLFEWLMYIAYITYLVTFTPEFFRFRLVLEAVPCSDVSTKHSDVSNDKPGDNDVTNAQSETTTPDVTNEITKSESPKPDVTKEVTQHVTTSPDVAQSETTPSIEDSSSDENVSSETKLKSV